MVDPNACTLEINVLRGQAYAPAASFGPEQTVRSELLADLALPVNTISLAQND